MTNSHEALNRQRVLQEQTTTTEQLGVPQQEFASALRRGSNVKASNPPQTLTRKAREAE